jgi:hypothetical protein
VPLLRGIFCGEDIKPLEKVPVAVPEVARDAVVVVVEHSLEEKIIGLRVEGSAISYDNSRIFFCPRG